MQIDLCTIKEEAPEAGERTFHLTLTERELDAVMAVCGRVMGPREYPHRKATSDLYYAAVEALGYRDDATMFRGGCTAQEAQGIR